METGFPSNIFSESQGVYLADTFALSSSSSPFHSHLAQWAPRCNILNKISIYLPSINAGYDIGQWTPTSGSHFSPLSDSSSVLCFLAPKLPLHDVKKSHPLLHCPFLVRFSPIWPHVLLCHSLGLNDLSSLSLTGWFQETGQKSHFSSNGRQKNLSLLCINCPPKGAF